MQSPTRWGSYLLYAVFFATGAAGLGCQMVWTRQFGMGLGHEMPALLAVVGAFFGGMALGAWSLDRQLARADKPARWYAVLEITIGIWTALTTWLIPEVTTVAIQALGPDPSAFRHGTVTFAVPFLALLPATFAMGATLPAMEQVLAPMSRDGQCVGGLYAANTLGALAGVLLGAYTLIPALGFRTTLWALAAVNLACGGLMLMWSASVRKMGMGRISLTSLPNSEKGADPTPRPGGEESPFWAAHSLSNVRLAVTLFITGLLGIGYEVLGVRALGHVLENTVFTFANVLMVYLLGTAVGATLFQVRLRRQPAPTLLANLVIATALAASAGMAALPMAKPVFVSLREFFRDVPAGNFFSEIGVAGLVFALPTVGMGATFSLLIQSAKRSGFGVGHALAVNSAGAALAGAVFGAALLPAIGLKGALATAALGYLVLLPRADVWRIALSAVPIAVILVTPRDLGLVLRPPGEMIVAHRDGLLGSVTVSKATNGVRTLRVDNRFQMGSTAALLPQRREAHLPLLLHPNPRRALFLGTGTGITLGAALEHPQLQVDGVELVPEVVTVMPRFAPENREAFLSPRASLFVADARRFVRTTRTSYDVIVADVFHPARDGAGALYTREHFGAIRRRLNPGGLFCQWLPLHQMDETTLRLIVRSFLGDFPEARACLLHFSADIPVLGLLGRNGPEQPLVTQAAELEADPPRQAVLREIGLSRPWQICGTIVAGPEALRALAGDAPLNTDDRPLVLFTAPRRDPEHTGGGGALLLDLLDHFFKSDELLMLEPDTEGGRRLQGLLRDYMAARDVYLHGLVLEARGEVLTALEAYLASAKRSLYFTPAYARSVNIIALLARTNLEEARRWFERLEQAQPGQPLGRRLLGPLLEGETR